MNEIVPDDTAFHIRAGGEGLLLFGDALLVWEGELSFQPDFLMDEPEQVKKATLERIDELLKLDFDHLLLAHGDPIIGRGRTALEEFAENPRSARLRRVAFAPAGAVAQLEERSAGSRKVRGSNPLSSTSRPRPPARLSPPGGPQG